jgi:hypothetical protein
MEILYLVPGDMGSDGGRVKGMRCKVDGVRCTVEEKALVGTKISNHKYQIPNKFQFPNSNDPNKESDE